MRLVDIRQRRKACLVSQVLDGMGGGRTGKAEVVFPAGGGIGQTGKDIGAVKDVAGAVGIEDPVRWNSNTAQALTGPSAAHWFGTDQFGRDILSRIVVATRHDLGIAVTSVALAFGFGTLLGLAAGYCGGWVDRIVGRGVDTIMAFPLFVLAMGIVAALGNSVENIVYATAIINLPIYARLARAEANVRRGAGYVEAARLCGNGEARIVLTQLLPNILPLMMVQVSLTLGYAICAKSAWDGSRPVISRLPNRTERSAACPLSPRRHRSRDGRS